MVFSISWAECSKADWYSSRNFGTGKVFLKALFPAKIFNLLPTLPALQWFFLNQAQTCLGGKILRVTMGTRINHFFSGTQINADFQDCKNTILKSDSRVQYINIFKSFKRSYIRVYLRQSASP